MPYVQGVSEYNFAKPGGNIALVQTITTPSYKENKAMDIAKEIKGGLHKVKYLSQLLEMYLYDGIFSSVRDEGMLVFVKFLDDDTPHRKYYSLINLPGTTLADWKLFEGTVVTPKNPKTVATLALRDALVALADDYVNVTDARTAQEMADNKAPYSRSFIYDGTIWLTVYGAGDVDPAEVAANSAARHNQDTDSMLLTTANQPVHANDLHNHLNDASIHFRINDGGEGDNEVWSSMEVANRLALGLQEAKAYTYSKSEIDNKAQIASFGIKYKFVLLVDLQTVATNNATYNNNELAVVQENRKVYRLLDKTAAVFASRWEYYFDLDSSVYATQEKVETQTPTVTNEAINPVRLWSWWIWLRNLFVKQATGVSTTDVMSQKATTDALALKSDKTYVDTKLLDKLNVSDQGVVYKEITHAAALNLYNTETLRKGDWYLITTAPNRTHVHTRGNILIQAVSKEKFAQVGYYKAELADYNNALAGHIAGREVWDGAAYAMNVKVIYSGKTWVATNAAIAGAMPGTNPVWSESVNLITEWDAVGYDISADKLLWREDKRGNRVAAFGGIWGMVTINNNPIEIFQWGNNNVSGNELHNSVVNVLNLRNSNFKDNCFYDSALEGASQDYSVFVENRINRSKLTSFQLTSNGAFRGNVVDSCTLSNLQMTASYGIVDSEFSGLTIDFASYNANYQNITKATFRKGFSNYTVTDMGMFLLGNTFDNTAVSNATLITTGYAPLFAEAPVGFRNNLDVSVRASGSIARITGAYEQWPITFFAQPGKTVTFNPSLYIKTLNDAPVTISGDVKVTFLPVAGVCYQISPSSLVKASQTEAEQMTSDITFMTPLRVSYFWSFVNKLSGYDANLAGNVVATDTFVQGISKLSRIVTGKLDKTLTNGMIWIGDNGGLAVARALTGDVTLGNNGVTTIGSERVVTGMLANNAATYKKMQKATAGSMLGNLDSVSAELQEYPALNLYDAFQKAYRYDLDGIAQILSSVISTGIDTVQVGNTIIETSLFGTDIGTKKLLAGFFVKGKTVRVKMRGLLNTTGNPTLQLKLKSSNTLLVATPVAVMNGTITNNYFELEVDITCRSVGSVGTVSALGKFCYDNADNTGKRIGLVAENPVTLSTIADQTLDVVVTWGTADANNYIRSITRTIEILN